MMKLPRRTFIRLTAGAVALPTVSRLAWAQTALSRPLRIVLGFSPGSASDIIARTLSQALSERIGQDIIIDHRPGAGGNVAVESVLGAPADGHTLLMVGPSSAINATLYEKLAFNVLQDIVPVAGIAQCPNVILVSSLARSPSVPDFIAMAKANPGAIKMASAGVGTATHLAGEMFNRMAGINTIHVAYRGGAGAYADLINGQVDVYFAPLASAMAHVKAGGVRPLALTTAHRQSLLDLPAAAEFVPGYQASTWLGIGTPRNTPTEIVDRLNADINAVLTDPNVATQIAAQGGTTLTGSPADFGNRIADETHRWATVLKMSHTTVS
jgi:tripartite-type tricarboxylate transporter receptor subunit TctC